MATFTSIRLHPIATAATLALSIAGAIRAEAAPERSKEVRSFLARYCYDCHGEETREGKLRLDDLSVDVEVDGQRWLGVLRKLEAGEMPPEDEQQPPAADSLRVTQWISRSLIAVNRRQQETEGRVVLRRLNRVEYENTIRDLLAIDIDVKDLLPEDAKAHGFDNIGAALNISSVLLERYLEAADAALTEAMTAGPRPESIKMRVSYKDERRVKDHESYLPLDDALVFFSAGYSPTEVNQFRAPRKGLYRVRVSAYAYQSERPVTFRAYGGINEKRHLAGYFDAQTTPTEVEFTTRLGRRNTIRIVPYGTRLKKWNDAARETGPGLAVQWVEIEGPLIEQWSPESHRRLFSDLPVEDLNAEARKRNRRLQPLHEVVSKDPAQDARRIFQRMLPKMFRRPVTGSEIDQYLDIVLAQLENGYRFQEAVRVGLKTALCSPDFLYLMERRGAPLDQFQVASRLSYFLWSTTPDEELVSLADDGKLRDRATLRRQTERMLNDPRAAAFTENFVGQWLGLRDIDFTTPDRMLYPEFDELLKVSMVQETRLFFDELLRNDLSVINFADADFSMLNERMARHYGIDGVRGQAFRKVQLPASSHRGGVLTHASVLKVTANGTNTSPVLRGIWVLENILGQPAPAPPADVPAVEPDIRGATTIREQLAKHRQIKSCAVCHKRIDPAGFALESFDVIGGWREYYRSLGEGRRLDVEVGGRRVQYKRGPPVDSGDVLPSGERFSGIDEYKQLLTSDKDMIARCVAKKLLTYSTGSGVQLADEEELAAIVKRIKEIDYGLRSLVHEVVQSQMFLNK